MRLYEAIGRYGGKPAGHVAYGRTRGEAARRSSRCHVSVAIKRSDGHDGDFVARLVELGKLDPVASKEN